MPVSNRDKIQTYFEKEHADFDATYSNPRNIKDFVRWAQYWYGKKPIKGRLNALVDLIGDGIKDVEILEVGSGPGYYSIELAKKGARVTGIDYANNMVDIARENARREGIRIDFRSADIFNFDAGITYNYVFATGVIEYIERPDHEKFIRRLSALSNDYVIVSFPKRYVLHAFIRYIWLRFLKGFRISYFVNKEISRIASNSGLREVNRKDVGILWVIKFKKV